MWEKTLMLLLSGLNYLFETLYSYKRLPAKWVNPNAQFLRSRPVCDWQQLQGFGNPGQMTHCSAVLSKGYHKLWEICEGRFLPIHLPSPRHWLINWLMAECKSYTLSRNCSFQQTCSYVNCFLSCRDYCSSNCRCFRQRSCSGHR